MERLRLLRKRWSEAVLQILGAKKGGILNAMLLGDKQQMDAEIKEQYQVNGIAHILAISGLHLSFCRTWLLSFCAQNKWLVSGGRLGRDYISVNVYRDDRLYGIGSPGGNYVLYAGGS